jgi:hypothetical protein
MDTIPVTYILASGFISGRFTKRLGRGLGMPFGSVEGVLVPAGNEPVPVLNAFGVIPIGTFCKVQEEADGYHITGADFGGD